MRQFGPLYCETGHPFLFIAEPVNTISNFVIIAFGLLAFALMRRKTGGYPPGPLVLSLLLLATGIGSLFWHAFRTPIALTFDVLPGLLFFVVFVFLWMQTMYGALAGIGALALVAASGVGASALLRISTPAGPFIPFFATTFLIGIYFSHLTRRRYGADAGMQAMGTLLLAGLAATFRSIDLMTCDVIPFGTHFLWHIFLSTAAYSGVAFLLRIGPKRIGAMAAA